MSLRRFVASSLPPRVKSGYTRRRHGIPPMRVRERFEVIDLRSLTGEFSSSTLPEVDIIIRDAETICEGDLELVTDAPEPLSSSEPFDVEP